MAVNPVLSSEPWFPVERLNTKSGVVIGYVIGDEGTEYVVLRERDRLIERIDNEDVEERSYCSIARYRAKPQRDYERC
jgi:hypothetical protein